MILNTRSTNALISVHLDLVKVVKLAALNADLDFIVTEGLRTMSRQTELYKKGATRTMNSRHLTGHAVDLAAVIGGDVRWDWPLYDKLADQMKGAAGALSVPIEWGGDWVSFKDGPHFQLPFAEYPK